MDELEDREAIKARLPHGLGFVVPIEHAAQRVFWAVRSFASLRLALELGAVAVLLSGVWGLLLEIDNRKEERLVRMWHVATDPRPGNSGKIPALEYLNAKGYPLVGIDIERAYLVGVRLSGADLSGANLGGADLTGAKLDGVDLRGGSLASANLTGATLADGDLSGAMLLYANFDRVDFSGAVLRNADLRQADMSGALGLTQPQLNQACVSAGGVPPKVPDGLLAPPKRYCE